MQEFQIEFYEMSDGTEPAKDFISSLDTKMRAKVLHTVALLASSSSLGRSCGSRTQSSWMMEFLRFAPSLDQI